MYALRLPNGNLLILVEVSDPQGLEVEAGLWAARDYH